MLKRVQYDEVDFIIERSGECVAIEVKSGYYATRSGITKFDNQFHPKHSLIVGSSGVPLQEFLSWDLSSLFD